MTPNCFHGPSFLYGVYLHNTITISCPGGTIATMCVENFMHELKLRNIQNVVVMRSTNNMFDKSSKPLMSAVVVVSDEM